jgi:RNA polymerase sigma factor (sigma-70 family)
VDAQGTDAALEGLLRRYAEGDSAALGELVEREAEGLARWPDRRMTPRLQRRVGVSDIIQQTAVELVFLGPRFENRGAGAFRRLLRTIAGRVLASAFARERAQKRDSQRGQGWVPAASRSRRASGHGEAPSRQVLRREEIDAVRRRDARLPPADQETVQLFDYEGLTYAEIARRLGISEAVARKRHSLAVARLRRLMDADGLLVE